ncbi:MAG: UDP-3-O-(3-hydroxymyristoyl)glucosamine N-acyltransferase [Elusimicrobiota bacterium]
MRMKVCEIANFLKRNFFGDGETLITRVSSIENADSNSIIFVNNDKDVKTLTTSAGCVIAKDYESFKSFKSVIVSPNPKADFSKLLALIEKENQIVYSPFISKLSSINPSAKVSSSSYVGDFVSIEEGSVIGDNVIIEHGVYIGKNSEIGDGTRIYPNVVIRENVKIGKSCIIHSNSVIGGDGFGFIQDKGMHIKIPQVGGVIIEDDVEIGSCVAIDRATIDFTIIGSGSKLDNLVHIAHNVRIGKNCLILAQAAIAGSTIIGDNVIIAGQAGISDHLKIGDGAIIMSQSGVIGNVDKNKVLFGTPARERGEFMRIEAALSKLPEIYKYFFKKIKK